MKKLIIGNWKMYPAGIKDAKIKFAGIKKVASGLRNVQTVICAPSIYIGDLKKIVTGHRCVIGAQNAWTENDGAYTGETSPAMIASLGISHVIIGHSERRALGETDELINKKIIAATKAGITSILCVGESVRDLDGEYLKFIAEQLKNALKGISKKDLKQVVIAYEPLWAIGKYALRAATAEDALEATISIRKTLSSLYGTAVPEVLVLYGGSVDPKNSQDFLLRSHVNGLLVGRVSLDVTAFAKILKDADAVK